MDFESFKESGGIEYIADVIWSLQLSVMDTMSFSRRFWEAGLGEKRYN